METLPGGSTQRDQRITCDDCQSPDGEKLRRDISDYSSSSTKPEESRLSTTLLSNREPFVCDGQKIWLGGIEEFKDECGLHLWGILKGASSLYYPNVRSAITIPSKDEASIDPKLEYLIHDYVMFSPDIFDFLWDTIGDKIREQGLSLIHI